MSLLSFTILVASHANGDRKKNKHNIWIPVTQEVLKISDRYFRLDVVDLNDCIVISHLFFFSFALSPVNAPSSGHTVSVDELGSYLSRALSTSPNNLLLFLQDKVNTHIHITNRINWALFHHHAEPVSLLNRFYLADPDQPVWKFLFHFPLRGCNGMLYNLNTNVSLTALVMGETTGL